MKKWLLFLILLVSTSLHAQVRRDSVYLDLKLYQVVYSEVLEQPKMVHYYVECPNGTASRKGLDFVFYKGVHSSDSKDYADNPYDKGHMAPAASFNCNEDMLYETFTFINCSLQHQSLNRGVWKKLENRERYLADFVDVQVFIRVEFDEIPKRVPSNAAIPKGYYKELLVGDIRECYYFPNKAPVSKELDDYKCECR